MENNNEAQSPVTQDEALPDHRCPKCSRRFSSPFGLRMHNVRAHGKGWDTSQNFGHKKKFNWRTARAKRMANLNRGGGKPWTREQHAKFRATMKAKSSKLRYVYPLPDEAQKDEAQKPNVRKVNHCPYCGEFILRHLTSGGWS